MQLYALSVLMWYTQEVKVTSPDYVGIDQDEAVQDFSRRIKNYETAYEPLDLQFDKCVKSDMKLITQHLGIVAGLN